MAGDPASIAASLPVSQTQRQAASRPCPGITRACWARLLKAACLHAPWIRSRTCPLAHRCIPSAWCCARLRGDAHWWLLTCFALPGLAQGHIDSSWDCLPALLALAPSPPHPTSASEIQPPHCCPRDVSSAEHHVCSPSPKPFSASSRVRPGAGNVRPGIRLEKSFGLAPARALGVS